MGNRGLTGPDMHTLSLVLHRARWLCEVCDGGLGHQRGETWSVHHRVPRGAGGTRRRWINEPPNLLIVCGSGTTGCHGRIESDRAEARSNGWLVPNVGNVHPETVSVLVGNGSRWVYLGSSSLYLDQPDVAA